LLRKTLAGERGIPPAEPVNEIGLDIFKYTPLCAEKMRLAAEAAACGGGQETNRLAGKKSWWTLTLKTSSFLPARRNSIVRKRAGGKIMTL